MAAELRSPPAWPVLGHLPALIRGGRPHRVLEDWCDRYGATYRLRLPGGPAVVTADPAIVSAVLRGRPRLFRRDPRITRTRKLRRNVVEERYAPIIDAIYGGQKSVAVKATVVYETGETGTMERQLAVAEI